MTFYIVLALLAAAGVVTALALYNLVRSERTSSESDVTVTHTAVINVPASAPQSISERLCQLVMAVRGSYVYLGWDSETDQWALALETEERGQKVRDVYLGQTQLEAILQAEKQLGVSYV